VDAPLLLVERPKTTKLPAHRYCHLFLNCSAPTLIHSTHVLINKPSGKSFCSRQSSLLIVVITNRAACIMTQPSLSCVAIGTFYLPSRNTTASVSGTSRRSSRVSHGNPPTAPLVNPSLGHCHCGSTQIPSAVQIGCTISDGGQRHCRYWNVRSILCIIAMANARQR
jgi:hypothetical protein